MNPKHDIFAAMSATIDALVYDELATVVGTILMDDGLRPTSADLEMLGEIPGDCLEPLDAARAFGRLAIDGANDRMVRHAHALQILRAEHLGRVHPGAVTRDGLRLRMIEAWIAGDRAALAAAAEALWRHNDITNTRHRRGDTP